MTSPQLTRYVSHGVTLLGDTARPGGVTFAFTERTGGVSGAPYASLNLGGRCGDDTSRVAENRRRVLAALGADELAPNLVEPHQVHGDAVAVVDDAAIAAAHAGALEADAVVCGHPGVPVLLCFADCVPVVLVAPGAFAVVHSGWRGTLARISAKAVDVLCREARCAPAELKAYIGPHIGGADYEVSGELLATFINEFGTIVRADGTASNLSLLAAIVQTLTNAGVQPCNVTDARVSTATNLERFYSYRAEEGTCGRHGAIAFL